MLPGSEYGDTGGGIEDNSNAPLLRDSTSLGSKESSDPRARHSLQSDGGAIEGLLLDEQVAVVPEEFLPWWSRGRFTGSVLFNVFTFLLPAIYMTMAKLWVSQLDSKMVVVTDIYAYVSRLDLKKTISIDIPQKPYPRLCFPSYWIMG